MRRTPPQLAACLAFVAVAVVGPSVATSAAAAQTTPASPPAELRSAGTPLTPAIEQALGALGDDTAATTGATGAASTEDTGGSTPWWVWVLLALGGSLVFSMFVGRMLKSSSDAYLPIGHSDRGDDVARLLEAARRLSGPLAPSDVSGVAVDEAVQLTQARHAAFVATSDAPTGPIVVAEHPTSRIDPTWLRNGVIGRVLTTGQPERAVLVDDAFGPEPVAVIVMPVLRSGRLVGVLCVDREPTRSFSAATQDACPGWLRWSPARSTPPNDTTA